MSQLVEYFENEFVPKMKDQLQKDQERWGDTWKHRPREGQEMRVYARYNDYFDMFMFAGEEVPWFKIVGNAVIAQLRLDHPEWLKEE